MSLSMGREGSGEQRVNSVLLRRAWWRGERPPEGEREGGREGRRGREGGKEGEGGREDGGREGRENERESDAV